MARRDASDLSRRPRVRIQMEHGLDARFPALHEHRSDLPEVPSQQYHLLTALRIHRTLHSGFEPRRNCVRQALTPIENAGRRMAEVRQSSHVFGVDVRASRKKTALHGWRTRSA